MNTPSAQQGNPQSQDFYTRLGVARNATTAEIKAAFRKLALIYHSDRNGMDKSKDEALRKLIEAYETLRDPKKRSAYDQGHRGNEGWNWVLETVDPAEAFELLLKYSSMDSRQKAQFMQILAVPFGPASSIFKSWAEIAVESGSPQALHAMIELYRMAPKRDFGVRFEAVERVAAAASENAALLPVAKQFISDVAQTEDRQAILRGFISVKSPTIEVTRELLPVLEKIVPDAGGFWQVQFLFKARLIYAANPKFFKSLFVMLGKELLFEAKLEDAYVHQRDVGPVNGKGAAQALGLIAAELPEFRKPIEKLMLNALEAGQWSQKSWSLYQDILDQTTRPLQSVSKRYIKILESLAQHESEYIRPGALAALAIVWARAPEAFSDNRILLKWQEQFVSMKYGRAGLSKIILSLGESEVLTKDIYHRMRVLQLKENWVHVAFLTGSSVATSRGAVVDLLQSPSLSKVELVGLMEGIENGAKVRSQTVVSALMKLKAHPDRGVQNAAQKAIEKLQSLEPDQNDNSVGQIK